MHAIGRGRELTSYEALLVLFSFLFENSRGSCKSRSSLVAALHETLIFNDILVSIFVTEILFRFLGFGDFKVSVVIENET